MTFLTLLPPPDEIRESTSIPMYSGSLDRTMWTSLVSWPMAWDESEQITFLTSSVKRMMGQQEILGVLSTLSHQMKSVSFSWSIDGINHQCTKLLAKYDALVVTWLCYKPWQQQLRPTGKNVVHLHQVWPGLSPSPGQVMLRASYSCSPKCSEGPPNP